MSETGACAAPPARVIAVDWSGRVDPGGQRKHIWIADWHEGELTLTSGRTRDEVMDYLVARASVDPALVVGLDFSFSYPAWFLRELGCETAADFWALVAGGKGEEWLRGPSDFFWGRVKRPASHHPAQAFRATEAALKREGKTQPKSGFQISGAGSVGAGSLRGIPCLHRLHQAGFSIWPFHRPRFPMALEIYPRIFTGSTITSKAGARIAHLQQAQYDEIPEEIRSRAVGSEDAFDALCAVIGMKDHAEDFPDLQQSTDPGELLEGKIWRPLPAFTQNPSP